MATHAAPVSASISLASRLFASAWSCDSDMHGPAPIRTRTARGIAHAKSEHLRKEWHEKLTVMHGGQKAGVVKSDRAGWSLLCSLKAKKSARWCEVECVRSVSPCRSRPTPARRRSESSRHAIPSAAVRSPRRISRAGAPVTPLRPKLPPATPARCRETRREAPKLPPAATPRLLPARPFLRAESD